MRQVFSSVLFDFEFLRVLGAAPYHGAEVGECLEAASWIKDGDAESWYRAWLEMGRKALVLGEEAQVRNDKTAACWAYLRASNYFRASEFFLHCTPDDDRILAAAQESVDAFDKAWILLDATVRSVTIPIGQHQKLPGRLYLPAAHQRLGAEKLPVILQTGGFDSTQEELYYYGAAGALPRGYAVLSFDGPGQGLPLRREKLRMRPDWEVITTKVIDYLAHELASEHGLDMDRLAIYGASLGGYLALRGAADARIKACVSVDGPYDLFQVAHSRMPAWFINGWLSGWLSDGFFNMVVDVLAATNFQLRWEFEHSKWVFGVDSPAQVMRAMQRFSLDDGKTQYLSRLRCPTLVTGPADSFYFTPAQNAERIFEGLSQLGPTEKELWIGKGKSCGGLQAKIGSLALLHHKVFTWLDDQFGIQRGGRRRMPRGQ
ncbi:fusarin C cluster-hydrolase [Ophiocordyceps camponoti-floridani]|uniref:Fusarin C cluster-hydrolase n=1 Tax=Ophiocordyceps camponoti-floridani TaxID=2030778 RepID=A0A8H4QE46_9HYPO|nr:fusarin C cluster-hydrolase [Ophiocordyceps camponoti-floridani]